MAAALLLLFCWITLTPPGVAQSDTQPVPQLSSTSSSPTETTSPKKKKKVWTEEELQKLHGGISVVGQPAPPPADKAVTDKAATGKATANKGILPAAEEEVAEASPERPPCKSWSWAADVDAVLSAQGVNLGREYWIDKSYGGSICTTELGDIATLAKRVEGDYVLDDQSKIRIQAVVFAGLPVDVVASQENTGIMSIMVYKGHPYVTTGYTGVRFVSPSGITVRYALQTVTMTDPYDDRTVILDHARDELKDFQGGVRFVVTRQ